MPQPSGTLLGPYRIRRLIGAGGMGEVYEATDTRLDRPVAIKVLPAQFTADPDRRSRFEREARAAGSLTHPHIATLHDVGEADGTLYLVMELVEGETLHERLQRGRLSVSQALDYAIQIGDALVFAHERGIVHRDLKPGNILLTRTGVKLLDFGLAKLQAPIPPAADASTAVTAQRGPLTADGTVLGTLQYMSPEQLEGREADARADVFAFGCILYEMLSGRRAFDGDSAARVMVAVLTAEPPVLAAPGDVPPALDHLVRRCLAKRREDPARPHGTSPDRSTRSARRSRRLLRQSFMHGRAVGRPFSSSRSLES
jgi:serine/threonine protein kinase